MSDPRTPKPGDRVTFTHAVLGDRPGTVLAVAEDLGAIHIEWEGETAGERYRARDVPFDAEGDEAPSWRWP